MLSIPRVLLIDYDDVARRDLARLLPRDRYACEVVPSAVAALERLGAQTFDAVIAEVHLADMQGLTLLERIKRARPALPVILVSSRGTVQEAVEAIKRGAHDYFSKPYAEAELVAAVDGAVAGRRRSSSGTFCAPASVREGMGLIGSSPAMRKLQEAIERVAASSAPVLITGESGAGKELVAHAVHARSARRNGRFVAVNTSAIPADLLEAEIFGHVRGGFTGAAQARKGLLTEASGGTLMLDEIGDMPFDLQAKLLRVLQSGEVRPVGSDHAHRVDVRVVAATHRDLQSLIREGRFREDLFFRLDVLPIVVPPLRERREDIPALVAHFLAEARRRSPGSPVRSIAPDALEMLASARWPGNVRELASVVERLVVFARDERIEVHHLFFLSKGPEPAPELVPADAQWTLRRVTQAYTEQVLAQTGGNKQRAAEILDVDLSTLYRWERSRAGARKRREAAGVPLEEPPPSST
jgi:two-component system, NtrC family, response regulator HydG